jgi:condensin complex subunit 2
MDDTNTIVQADGAAGGEDEDLLAATQGQLKRVRPISVNYAKKAKRVDVKKLKENIWKGLEMDPTSIENVRSRGNLDYSCVVCLTTVAVQGSTPEPEEPRTFEKVLKELQSRYPKDKFDDLSTSFCFICLLHLANEQGLRILSNRPMKDEEEDEEEMDEDERRVLGGLETLRIIRETAVA